MLIKTTDGNRERLADSDISDIGRYQRMNVVGRQRLSNVRKMQRKQVRGRKATRGSRVHGGAARIRLSNGAA